MKKVIMHGGKTPSRKEFEKNRRPKPAVLLKGGAVVTSVIVELSATAYWRTVALTEYLRSNHSTMLL